MSEEKGQRGQESRSNDWRSTGEGTDWKIEDGMRGEQKGGQGETGWGD